MQESNDSYFLFFFQAEDGIRDKLVTGVQTCALPISQGRNLNRKNIQPIKKVHAKSTVVNFPFEVFVGSSNHADVRLDRSVSPDAFKLPLLQHSQERHLYLRAQLGDLVKKDRAAIGSFEPANALLQRAGESAFLVPEQFAGDQLSRQCRAIHLDQGPSRTIRAAMNGVRDQFFAGSSFTSNQDG